MDVERSVRREIVENVARWCIHTMVAVLGEKGMG